MAIKLQTTFTLNVDRHVGTTDFQVLVNGAYAASWIQPLGSDPNAPIFEAIATVGYEDMRVFTPNFDWQRQYIDGNATPSLRVPFSRLADATETALASMFPHMPLLTFVDAFERVDVTLGDEVVLSWQQTATDEDSYVCFGKGATVYYMDGPAHQGFEAFASPDHNDCWSRAYIEKVTPFAYRALVNGWAR